MGGRDGGRQGGGREEKKEDRRKGTPETRETNATRTRPRRQRTAGQPEQLSEIFYQAKGKKGIELPRRVLAQASEPTRNWKKLAHVCVRNLHLVSAGFETDD